MGENVPFMHLTTDNKYKSSRKTHTIDKKIEAVCTKSIFLVIMVHWSVSSLHRIVPVGKCLGLIIWILE